jgi:uncharacterized membrane protein
MIGPTWLAAIFGVIMLVAAVVAAVRIIAAWRAHRTTDYQIDIHNVLMGVSMSGMLIPSLLIVTTGPSTIAWLVVWSLLTIWFALSVARDAAQRTHRNRFTGHHLPHLVMSAAMVYVFAVMLFPASDGRDSGMSGMSAGGGLVPLATLDYAFVIFMVGYAVLVVDRLPAIAATGSGDLQIVGHGGAVTTAQPLATTTAAIINIVMAITMGYMLTMMFP